MGHAVEVNWFVASNSLGTFDIAISKMMGLNWKSIEHLREAVNLGFISDPKGIKVIGDMEHLKKKFILKRNIWNYPALLAFNSKKLTHFFIFLNILRFFMILCIYLESDL